MASVFAVAIWAANGRRMKAAFLNHDKCVASSLIGQGVDESVITRAFAEREITKEGTALLTRMGIKEETGLLFLPDIWGVQKGTGLWLAGLFLCLWAGLLFLTASFFESRDRVYEKAIRLVDRFMDGDFKEHLPRMEEGGLCRFLGKVDGLANALSAGNEIGRAHV